MFCECRKKLILDQERAQQEADIKIRGGEVAALQKELDAINVTVHMLDKQKAEAQKRLDDLDEKVYIGDHVYTWG